MAHLDRRPGLSDTARARHRDHAVLLEQADQRGEVGIPPEEWRTRIGKVARQARESLALAQQEVGGRDGQPTSGDREDLERATDVLELELPQVHKRELRLVPDLIVNGIGYKDSPGDPERLDARSDVDRVADETGGFDDHIADVDADPHGDVRRLAELLLDLDGTPDGIERIREDGQCSIAVVLDDPPA